VEGLPACSISQADFKNVPDAGSGLPAADRGDEIGNVVAVKIAPADIAPVTCGLVEILDDRSGY